MEMINNSQALGALLAAGEDAETLQLRAAGEQLESVVDSFLSKTSCVTDLAYLDATDGSRARFMEQQNTVMSAGTSTLTQCVRWATLRNLYITWQWLKAMYARSRKAPCTGDERMYPLVDGLHASIGDNTRSRSPHSFKKTDNHHFELWVRVTPCRQRYRTVYTGGPRIGPGVEVEVHGDDRERIEVDMDGKALIRAFPTPQLLPCVVQSCPSYKNNTFPAPPSHVQIYAGIRHCTQVMHAMYLCHCEWLDKWPHMGDNNELLVDFLEQDPGGALAAWPLPHCPSCHFSTVRPCVLVTDLTTVSCIEAMNWLCRCFAHAAVHGCGKQPAQVGNRLSIRRLPAGMPTDA